MKNTGRSKELIIFRRINEAISLSPDVEAVARAILDIVIDETPAENASIMMPGLDGHMVCDMLKKSTLTWSIPVIYLTAYADEATMSRAKPMKSRAAEVTHSAIDTPDLADPGLLADTARFLADVIAAVETIPSDG